eukprot:NODE_385_length_9550_cov_0.159877.p8 type:complete len:101 gc:universal NODE_385_length_9550_cov_0.159877:1033-1335(+)
MEFLLTSSFKYRNVMIFNRQLCHHSCNFNKETSTVFVLLDTLSLEDEEFNKIVNLTTGIASAIYRKWPHQFANVAITAINSKLTLTMTLLRLRCYSKSME